MTLRARYRSGVHRRPRQGSDLAGAQRLVATVGAPFPSALITFEAETCQLELSATLVSSMRMMHSRGELTLDGNDS